MGGAKDSRFIAVVEVRRSAPGRFYRLPTPAEESVIEKASIWLETYGRKRADADPQVPSGSINHLRGFFNIVLYGMKIWGDAFNPRQLVVLITLSRLVCIAGQQNKE
jgi:adenine-specific DNA methylase